MTSNILDRFSFISFLLVVTLLPVFFLPFTKIPIETSKSLLLVVGLAVSVVLWAIARFYDGKISLPRSSVLIGGLGVVFSFFLSSFFSPAVKTSLFGTMFDVGTFWFMFACFLLMFVGSVVVRNIKQARVVLVWVFVSATLVLVFQLFRLYSPELLSFGILGPKTGTILGSWNTLGVFAGFLALLSLFTLEFVGLPKISRNILKISLLLSVVFSIIINFSLIWWVMGSFALVIFIFKVLYFSTKQHSDKTAINFPILPLILMIVSLFFIMSRSPVREFVPGYLGINLTEIRPSLEGTLIVIKETLKQDPILGAGPNRFGDMWSMHKPLSINSTQFLDTYFDFGWGLLPTFAATTGVLGIIAWLFFLFCVLGAGLRSMARYVVGGAEGETIVLFFASMYLLTTAFFYPTGATLFLLAFAFIGVFAGLSVKDSANKEVSVSFAGDPKKSSMAIILLVFVLVVVSVLSFKFIERFISVPYFSKTLTASSLPVAESYIVKAVSLNPNDLYLRTYAQIYLLKLNSLIVENSATSPEKSANLQATFDQAINGVVLATAYNNKNYLNLKAQGIVYESAASLGVAGAYDRAIESYKMASDLNPLNPGLKFGIARAYFGNGNLAEAKNYAEQSLALKEDYLDTIVLLSRIAESAGNRSQALVYGQRALVLAPENQDLIQYVNTLR